MSNNNNNNNTSNNIKNNINDNINKISYNNNNINNHVKSSDTNTDVSDRIFIMGDSIVKHVRGYELSRKVENCKVYVKSFSGAKAMCMEDCMCMCMDNIKHHGKNDQYQRKVADVNRVLKENYREKKLQFLDHGNIITVRHLNASKLHLNKRGTEILSNVFAEAISNITNGQLVLHSLASDNRKNLNTSDYDENKAKFKVGAISASNLNAICKRNINRLIIGQLNINSLRNKFKSLVQQVSGNIDILMVSETKSDNSFPVS